jgi:hypothetical protein
MESITPQVSERSRILRRAKDFYTATAIVVLTAIALLTILNVLLFGVFFIKDSAVAVGRSQRPKDNGRFFNSDGSPADNGKRNDYELAWFDYAAYENIPEEYAADVLDDFYDLSRLGVIYQPWVEFSEPPFSGKRVHVDRDVRGFPVRRTMNRSIDSNRPVINIFVLGGSTTFGYHVSDEHTWPSYLSQILNDKYALNIQVTNYGRGNFNPSQEAVLLLDLLKSGHRPSLVIFMDGVNPPGVMDVPPLTPEVAEGFRRLQFPPSYSEQFAWIPMARLASFFGRQAFGGVVTAATAPEENTKGHVETAVTSFRQSRDIAHAIATLYGVPTLFFLQPNTFYNYDTHLLRNEFLEGFGERRVLTTGICEQLKADKEYIDLTGLFMQWGNRKAVVDDSHYSPGFNEFLADRVAGHIAGDRLKPRQMAPPIGGVRTQ